MKDSYAVLTSLLFCVLVGALPPVSAALPAADRTASSLSDLVITELMYQPPDRAGIDGDAFEFIELKNTGSEVIDLTGVVFSAGISYAFKQGTALAPGGFYLLASDTLSFKAKYGFFPDDQYTGRLNNGGERVSLADANGIVFYSVRYNDREPWPLAPAGFGFSLVPNVDNPDDAPEAWRGSSRLEGSPGADDEATGNTSRVLVNELLAHTDPPQQDMVELFNPTNERADLSNWYLTDNRKDPKKYRFPSGTMLGAGGYLVLSESEFNPTPGVPPSFTFSSLGEEVFVFSADAAGNLNGFVIGFEFGASANGVSFGRHANSAGAIRYPAQQSLSFGAPNTGPRSGPVVINELMYNGPVGGDEFIELHNVSDKIAPFFDPDFPVNTWQVEGVGFVFPISTTLAAGAYALVVPIEPEAFRSKYGIAPEVLIVGPYDGQLSNSGERVSLRRPDTPQLDGTVPYIEVDAVDYSDGGGWPDRGDGDGHTIERIAATMFGDDPRNWEGSDQSGGTPGRTNSVATGVADEGMVPRQSKLLIDTPYPNPFTDQTHLSVTSPVTQEVEAVLLDLLGREVKVLYKGRVYQQSAQMLTVSGVGLSNGLYFVRISGQGGAAFQKVLKVE